MNDLALETRDSAWKGLCKVGGMGALILTVYSI
jgi:hypothetical protein